MSHQPLKVFDSQNPPSMDLISDCVHCGFCLQACPTYRLWGQEGDSPRGRIYLMKLGLENQAILDQSYVEHFDQCLGCMSCMTACPSGVQYDKLIEATRAQIQRRYPRGLSERLFRWMIFAIFPHPRRLRFIAAGLWLFQKTGLRSAVQMTKLLGRFPRLEAMDRLMPTINRTAFSDAAEITPDAPPRLRVGLLLGCVARVFFGDVNQATARVLAAEGCQVVIPPDQGCCGALAQHSGEEEMAKTFARRTIDAFADARIDVIAINAAGCGSAMKEYAHLLRDDPCYAARAREFADKCRDISEILADLPPIAARHPLPMRVAYHDACHLQHAQRITAQPRQLLRTIPQLEILEIEDASICCGSAGIYNMLQPDAARELGQRKAENIKRTQAAAVVSGNPGCTLQISTALQSAGNPLPVLHWIQLLDASITNTPI